ncbi:MAG: sigma-70 family RNA polymerase sigma factor [Polyangiaceae bacterium]
MAIDFEQHRGHLRGVAYRMLGSLAEAEDAVQEAWLRHERGNASDIGNPRGWLTTVTSRVCLDMLRSRRSRAEEPLAPHTDRPTGSGAEQELMLADSVGLALLVVLDKLEPAERIAFVLHDLFGTPFDEIADIVGRTPDAARQLASRARRRVQGSPPPDVDLANQRQLVESFILALRRGDIESLIAVLDPEVVGRAVDDKGNVREVRGARNWASGAVAFAKLAQHMAAALVDGSVGLLMAPRGRLFRVLRFTFEGGLIARAEVVAGEQLAGLEITALDAPAPAEGGSGE